nr:chondroitin sulfate synthase 1 isoform X1 [Onthophagus taurus]
MPRKNRFLHVLLGILLGTFVSVVFVARHRGSSMCLPPAKTVRRKHLDPLELIGVNNNSLEDKHLLFVGVMTAAGYLDNRAETVYNTWGKEVPGKIAFFSSEGSYSNSIPLVALKGVDDSYPPQKKSFTMLKYMHDHYIDRFEWFMRADDDVYVRTDRLEVLLRSVDSRKPWFIGQTGRGNTEEFGLLALESDENFCMGGPGVILSRETLKRIAPYLEDCLRNLYTTHEDVELGRCVKKHAGISCTWSYEASDYKQMQVILYHNQSGSTAFTGDLKQKEVHKAITLHPVKQPQYMQRLHKYVKGLKIQSLSQESVDLHRDIASSMAQLNVPISEISNADLAKNMKLFDEEAGSDDYLGDPTILGIPPSYSRFKPKELRDVLDWEFINRTVFSAKDLNPKRRIPSSMREGIDDILREAMDIINQYSKQRGRIIDYKDIYYGYWRLDPKYGVDVILDLLLVYRKYRGHKMTVTVRRHAYIQQTFTGIEVREIDINQPYTEETNENNLPFHEKLIKQISRISSNLQLTDIFDSSSSNASKKKRINFILPLSGRFKTFKRFMDVYEEVCIKENDPTTLIIVLYKENLYDYEESLGLIENVQMKYKNYDIKTVLVNETFARGRALQFGVETTNQDDLLFFIDVDIVFNAKSLMRIRQNTIQHFSVYYPIVYSMYDPEFFGKKYDIDDYKLFENESLLNEDNGFWRQFGFGIVSLYKSDFIKLGGFNTTIVGWGMEDVNFYDSTIMSRLKVVRSADPGLIHVYHPVQCDNDNNLDNNQRAMCLGTKASTFGSLNDLQIYFLKNKHLFS